MIAEWIFNALIIHFVLRFCLQPLYLFRRGKIFRVTLCRIASVLWQYEVHIARTRNTTLQA